MEYDERNRNLSNVAVGMADIQLAHNPIASEVIIIFNELSVDHYQDSRIAEVGRFKKLAVFRKTENMEFVPDSDRGELQIDDDSVPYEVLLTCTGLPRMPRRDDMVLSGGELYSVHHVKPMNRNINGLWQLIVYPERTTFIDTLHIYKSTLLNPKDLMPIEDIDAFMHEDVEPVEPIEEGEDVKPQPITKEVVVDFVWGGKPEFISYDKTETWLPFRSRIKVTLSEVDMHPVLYIKGGMEVIQVII